MGFSPDGKSLFSADQNGQLRVWNVTTGTFTTFNDGSVVTDPAISPDGRYLASGDVSGNVRIWNLTAGTKVTWDNGSPVGDVAFSPNGSFLAVGDEDGGVSLVASLVWKDSSTALEQRLCNELGGYNMTRTQWATYIPSHPYGATCPSCL